MKTLTAATIAEVIQGRIIQGSGERVIVSVAKLNEATMADLGFFSNPKYESQVYESACGTIIVPEDFTPAQQTEATLIAHKNPYFAFCQILTIYFNPNKVKIGIHPTASIHPSATIGENAYIGAYTCIGEEVIIGNNAQIHERVSIGEKCIIGNNVLLFPGVTIYNQCKIGDKFTAHAGTVIGSDGFGFAPVDGVYVKIPQVGIVEIEDDVEIGANCCIDRATMGRTLIKKGTKIDNLVQIAHNVEVGEHVVIASQAGFAGSSKIGHHCVFGGQVGMVGHIEIAPYNSFGGQAGITSNITKTHQKMTGTPAMEVNAYLRGIVGTSRINDIQKEIKELKKEIETLRLKNNE